MQHQQHVFLSAYLFAHEMASQHIGVKHLDGILGGEFLGLGLLDLGDLRSRLVAQR